MCQETLSVRKVDIGKGNQKTAQEWGGKSNAIKYARKVGPCALIHADGSYTLYYMEYNTLRQHTWKNVKFI